MSKKELNQNDKIKLDLIDTFEPDFIFNDKPINRFKINNSNNHKNILDKAEKLSELKKIINSIESCDLKNNSKNLILGDGNANSPLMLIGEAPGAEEDLSCLAFQGEVGKLLKKMLIAINIKIDDVYLTYSVNFRPPNDRKPTTQEIKRYSEFLKEHIAIINPKLKVFLFIAPQLCEYQHPLSNVQHRRILHTRCHIGQLRLRWYRAKLKFLN